MNALFVGLSLAGAASAQMVANGVSMVNFNPNYMNPGGAVASSAAGYAAASSSGGYAPPQASYTPPPSATYGAASSVVTPPPSSSADFYSQMPYSSFMAGGYQSLECGYGYQKGSDGSCQKMSWVCAAI